MVTKALMDQARKNQRIARLLHEVTQLVDQAAERTLREHTVLTLSQFLLLLGLAEQDDAPTQQDVAASLGIDRAAVSRQLTRLEGRGLIARQAEDGRSNAVYLTAEGATELARAQQAMKRHMKPYCTAPRDPDAFIEALEAIGEALRRSLGRAGGNDAAGTESTRRSRARALPAAVGASASDLRLAAGPHPPSSRSRSTRRALRADHNDARRRGVKRGRKLTASTAAFGPSIQPLHSASSSAPA